jgi:hypothetical protein
VNVKFIRTMDLKKRNQFIVYNHNTNLEFRNRAIHRCIQLAVGRTKDAINREFATKMGDIVESMAHTRF